MNLTPVSQKNLYGLNSYFNELVNLYEKKKFPSKILLSGNKGIGKCTMAYHLINYILSKEEEYPYDLKKMVINENNKSFKLIINRSNPNLQLIDVNKEKKNIEVSQVRELINNLNKSSLNSKPRFVLIDNIEFLNINSVNALLKILEEPNENIFFILINNNKRILPTLKSRCLNFRIILTNSISHSVINKILEKDLSEVINKDLVNFYFSPGNIYHLIKFAHENEIDLSNLSHKQFLSILIKKNLYKKDIFIKNIFFEMIEFFISKKKFVFMSNHYEYFLRRIDEIKKFNLDEESLAIEFEDKILYG